MCVRTKVKRFAHLALLQSTKHLFGPRSLLKRRTGNNFLPAAQPQLLRDLHHLGRGELEMVRLGLRLWWWALGVVDFHSHGPWRRRRSSSLLIPFLCLSLNIHLLSSWPVMRGQLLFDVGIFSSAHKSSNKLWFLGNCVLSFWDLCEKVTKQAGTASGSNSQT